MPNTQYYTHETAWAELNSTISRPFPKPERRGICVKVINHSGDEVQKVFLCGAQLVGIGLL
jgi:adenine-specific DNA-methyltransferase